MAGVVGVVVAFFVVGAAVACSSSDSTGGANGTDGGGGPSSSSGSTSGGGPVDYPEKTMAERCKSLCTNYDGSHVGAGYLTCGPTMFSRAPGNYECQELCDEFLPPGGPVDEDPCGSKLSAFVECAWPCKTDFTDPPCGFGQTTCETVGKCDPGGIDTACADHYSNFLERKGLDPDAGAKRDPISECHKVCQKQTSANCAKSDCDLGCTLYAGTSQACKDAALVEADCYLAAADICKADCGEEVQAKLKACN